MPERSKVLGDLDSRRFELRSIDPDARLPSDRGRSKLTVGEIWLIVLVVSAVWVGADASKRDWSGDSFANTTWQWILGVALLWIVVVPVYLTRRPHAPLKGRFAPLAAPTLYAQAGVGSPSSAPEPRPSADSKSCPDCAETIRAAAQKCRFCGYRFDGPHDG
jgi:hypothetical protein